MKIDYDHYGLLITVTPQEKDKNKPILYNEFIKDLIETYEGHYFTLSRNYKLPYTKELYKSLLDRAKAFEVKEVESLELF